MSRLAILSLLMAWLCPFSVKGEQPRFFRKQIETNIMCLQAASLLNRGKLQDAEKIYLDVLEKNRNEASAYDGLSRIYETRGELSNAEKYSLAACGIEPLNPTYQGQLGILYMKEGKLTKAIEMFQHATQIKGYNTDKYFQLMSECLRKRNGYYLSAEAELGRLRTRGWDDTVYVDAARKYFLAGDTNNGKRYKRMAGNAWNEYEFLTVRQRSPQAWTAFKNKKYLEAARLFTSLAEYESSIGEYDRMAGLAFKKIKDPVMAENHFRAAILKDPKDVKSLNELGALLFESGRTKEAIIQFEKAVSIDPQQIFSWSGAAKAYAEEGKHLPSARSWLHAYELATAPRIKAKYIENAGAECVRSASASPRTAKEFSKKIIPLLPEQSPSLIILKKLKEP